MRTKVQHRDGAALTLQNRALIAAALFLAILIAGVQLARAATVPAAAPSTTAYHSSSHPMISGTVVTASASGGYRPEDSES